MKKLIPFYLFFLAVHATTAQTISTIIKNDPQIDLSRLAKIDNVMIEVVEKKQIAGAVVLIVKNNQIIYYKAFGDENIEKKKRMQKDAIFRIMSQTKAITSLGILQLMEQGKLKLDQPIADFIPEFKNPKRINSFNAKDSSYSTIPADRDITFRDLLTHTSGIDYADIGTDTMRAIYTKNSIPSGLGFFSEKLLDKMKKLGSLPILHNPGTRFTYGLNTDLLGCLIEVISGKSLEVYFSENIFKPLGMKDTYFNVPKEKANRLPTVYTEDENQKIIVWSPTFRNIDPAYPLMQKSYFSGGAGLSSTAFDYAIFLQMLLNGGRYDNKQILGRRTVELFLSPQLEEGIFGADNFSLGFAITSKKSAQKEMKNERNFGWGGYYGTSYWADPREKLICIIMTQQNPNSHGSFFSTIENILFGSLK